MEKVGLWYDASGDDTDRRVGRVEEGNCDQPAAAGKVHAQVLLWTLCTALSRLSTATLLLSSCGSGTPRPTVPPWVNVVALT